MTTITTAAELQALPVGTVLRDVEGHVWARDPEAGWFWAFGDMIAPEVMADPAECAPPYVVLYRPDEPVATTVDREAAVERGAKALWDRRRDHADDPPWGDPELHARFEQSYRDDVSAVLDAAMLPATVKPTRGGLARLLDAQAVDEPEAFAVSAQIAYEQADRILAVWPGRTEAEVRADERERLAQEIEAEAAAGCDVGYGNALEDAARIAREGGRTDG